MTQPDPQFEALLQYLKEARGFDFTGYKRSSLMRRVGRRMAQVNVPEYAEYLDYLQVHPDEFTATELERWSMTSDTPVGRLGHLAPVLRLSVTPPRWARPSVPLGYNEPVWPAR